MRRGRVAYGGAIHDCVEHDVDVLLEDGRSLPETEVVWLPPFAVGTVFAVGLNYADHAKELASARPKEPLLFLKSAGALAGHRAGTRRPQRVEFMHYECELAVVIGRTCRNVGRADAAAVIQGYAVANDYAIRDYLENYYRPNLRVKNRDACTLLGPWLVDAANVADPQNLTLRTWVNGVMTQQGSTRDMLFGVHELIEYLSSFMTLGPGDVILTGTPQGVVNVSPGDEVVTEVESVGRLVNFVVDDATYGIEPVAQG
jgi:5-oxopent-3-ene-1,2,5-tricarboxylate decarboxylase/2-hydroxyhepta-2,4-diene-1,7-dioate isomerase